MTYKPVDTAIVMVVGPCIDNTDFKSLEEAIAYNAAGMDVSLIVEKTDGTTAVTAITLTTGGTSDWTHKDGGYYEIEVTAAQNAEEGIAYVRGVCTGVLPFESIHYNVVKANVYDSWIKGTDVLQTDVTQWLGTAAATPSVAGVPEVDLTHMNGTTQAVIDLKDFADVGYDSATNKVQGVVLVDTTTALTNAPTNGDLTATMKTSVNDQVVDVIRTDTTSEMSQGAPPVDPTIEEMLAYPYFKMRNKQETTSSEDAIYDDAGTTKLFKSAISDDGTTFTKQEYGTGA